MPDSSYGPFVNIDGVLYPINVSGGSKYASTITTDINATDKQVESVSGLSETQAEINEENKIKLEGILLDMGVFLPLAGGTMLGPLVTGGLLDELVSQVRNSVILASGTSNFSSVPNNTLIIVEETGIYYKNGIGTVIDIVVSGGGTGGASDTSELDLANAATESISGTAEKQSETNEEFVTEIGNIKTDILTLQQAEYVSGIRRAQTVTVVSNTATIDLAGLSLKNGNAFNVSPAAANTIAVSNATPVANTFKEFEIHITLGATAYAITWFSNITWLDGIPSFSINKTGACVFRTIDGINFIGNLAYEY